MARKIASFLSFLVLACATPVFAAGTVELPQTGQEKCYNAAGAVIGCTGSRQDGDVEAGAVWPSPRFTVNGDCVTDNLTGLMWPKDANLPNGRKTWSNAIDYAATLTLCTYSDWRLPNINELESLINIGVASNVLWLSSKGFTRVQPVYWSSTTVAGAQSAKAWLVGTGYGGDIDYDDKTVKLFLWPVRGTTTTPAEVWKTGQTQSFVAGDDGDLQAGAEWPEPRFTEEGECVRDNLTDLMWTKTANVATSPVTWKAALDAANNLNNCGYLDWRLPNRKELLSLIDRSQSYPALPADHPFTGVQSQGYWTSSTYAPRTKYGWAIITEYGHGDYVGKNGSDGRYYVWAVRGGSIPAPPSLSVSRSGNGTGMVTSAPAGIDCGSACKAPYAKNTIVTLGEQPGVNSVFSGWSGECRGKGVCKIRMDGNKYVGAAFDKVTCAYAFAPKRRTFSYRTGSIKVTITAKNALHCSAPSVSADADWISLSPLTFDRNRGYITITVSENSGSSGRNGTVTIGDSPFAVIQAGKPCSLTLTPSFSSLFPRAGGEDSFTVHSTPTDCAWSTKSNASWIKVTSGASGTGDGTVAYQVAASNVKPARNGTIGATLTVSKKTAKFKVRQDNK